MLPSITSAGLNGPTHVSVISVDSSMNPGETFPNSECGVPRRAVRVTADDYQAVVHQVGAIAGHVHILLPDVLDLFARGVIHIDDGVLEFDEFGG